MATPKTSWISLILMSRSIKMLSQRRNRTKEIPPGVEVNSSILLPSSLPFFPLISPHGWTKDGPIARFIATLKRTYLLWSRCSRGKSSWPLNFETSLRVQARIGRNRCTSFPNAPTLLPFVHQSPFVFNFLANLYAFPRLVKWKRNSREF